MNLFGDPAKLMQAQAQMWTEGSTSGSGRWPRRAGRGGAQKSALAEKADKDRRFAAPEWRDNPLFDTIRQTYLLVSERLLGSVDAIEGVDEATREKMRFTTRAFVDAMAPTNFALTNPQVIERAMETKGESLLHGLEHMLKRPGEGPAHPCRAGRVRGRPQHRDDAGQGGQADRRSTSSSNMRRRPTRCWRRR